MEVMEAQFGAIPDKSLNTLIDFKYKQHQFAKNGKPGQGKKKR